MKSDVTRNFRNALLLPSKPNMSALHRQLLMPGFPPPAGPPRSSGSKGPIRKRDYTPVKWDKYFESCQDVKTNETDSFRVYRRGTSGPLLLLLHGGGYCGLTWATLTSSIMELIECQVAAIDLRGHGDTVTDNDEDLSAETLSNDIGNVIRNLFEDSPPEIILVGHSMGGAVAVHTVYRELIPTVIGLAVIDVVEGTAMDALQSMQAFLRSRPSSFRSIETAIEWCVRSGQVRNTESAKVSMPGQIKNTATNKPATYDLEMERPLMIDPSSSEPPKAMLVQRGNSIPEEQEELEAEAEEKKDEEKETHSAADIGAGQGDGSSESVVKTDKNLAKSSATDDDNFFHPGKVVDGPRYTWRIDLSRTEKYWPGWFHGLSTMFLSCGPPKMLLLAGVDRLDRELTIGQMQGKFQMQVLPQCGHAVHEDVPDKVAEVLATFMVRHRFVQPTASFQPSFPAC